MKMQATADGQQQGQWYSFTRFNEVSAASNLPSLSNRGLAYGDGFFTTMRVAKGTICWQAKHIERIRSHAQALSLAIDAEALSRLQTTLELQAQKLHSGIMKLIMTRAAQDSRGYGFTDSAQGSGYEGWLYVAPTIPSADIDPASSIRLPDGLAIEVQPPITAVCLNAKIACQPPPLAGLKTLNRLDNVLASGELQRVKSAYPDNPPLEGLVKDMGGTWVEGTMSNVFYQLADNECWLTPPLEISGVRGVMRSVIMEAFAVSEQPIIERRLVDSDLSQLSRLFFCNAVRGVIPVSMLIVDKTRNIKLSELTGL